MGTFRYEYADSLEKVTIQTVAGEIECVGASYNGVPFLVEEVTSNGGRNIVSAALPFTNQHVNEDTGKILRQFPMKFYLVGSDVNKKLADLEEAFNTEGAFELVHPYYGKFKVRCGPYTVTYTTAVQEYVTGEVTFIPEVDPKKSARSVVDLKGQAAMKAQNALEDSSSSFKQNFNILQKARNTINSVSSAVSSALDAVESARQTMRDVSGFVNEISRIRSNIGLLLQTPGDFAARFQDLFTMTKETFGLDGGFVDYVNESLVLMDSVEFDGGSMVADSLSDMIRRMALMSAAAMATKSVVECSFSSSQELDDVHDRFAAAFERARNKVDSVDDYMALADMESTALKYIREEVSKLPVIVDLPLLASRDAITVCYDCYGNLDKLEEIIERNGIFDPMVINRESLKVLSK